MPAKKFLYISFIAAVVFLAGYVAYTWPMTVDKSYQGLVVSNCGTTVAQPVPVHLKGTLRRHILREDVFRGRLLVNNTPMEISSQESHCRNLHCLYTKLNRQEIRAVVHTRGHGRRIPAGTIVFTPDFRSIGGSSTFLSQKYNDPKAFFAAPAQNPTEAEWVFRQPM